MATYSSAFGPLTEIQAQPVMERKPELIVEVSFDQDPGATYYDSVLNDSPNGYWRLGEPSGTTATDETGTNNGTYSGSPTLGVTGAIPVDEDTAVTFDGTDDLLTINDSASLSATAALSVECWAKFAAYPGSTKSLMVKSGSWNLSISSAGHLFWAVTKTGPTTQTYEWTTPLPLNVWHHIVGTYDGANIYLYVDGELIGSAALVGAVVDNANAITVGGASAAFMAVTMDEVAYYPYALLLQNVENHYRSQDVILEPTWTDISDDVIAVSTKRGRQYELDRIEASTCNIILDNVSRDYDPTNTSSPHYPNVLPMRQVRVRAANNELENIDFEDDVSGWRDYIDLGATLSQDIGIAHTGIASLKVETPGGFGEEGAESDLIAAPTGTDVQASFWIKAEEGVDFRANLLEYDASEIQIDLVSFEDFTGTGDWQEVVMDRFTTEDSVYYVTLQIGTVDAVETTFNIDSVKLERIYPIFWGFIERWPIQWEGVSYSSITIQATDGFILLSRGAVTGTLAEDFTGTQIDALLSLAQWPRNKRNIDTGQSETVELELSDGTKALSPLQDISYSELGLFYIDPNGDARFQDRDYRTNNSSSYATFSDEDEGIEYLNIVPSFDWDRIKNEWLISPHSSVGGATAQRVTDETSIRKFGRQTQSKSTNLTSNADALAQAQYLLLRTSNAALRIEQMQLEPLNDFDLWQQVFKRDLSDRVTVERHPGAGSAISQASVIESIAWNIEGDRWISTWELSPADTSSLFTLNDASLGQLDSINVLGY